MGKQDFQPCISCPFTNAFHDSGRTMPEIMINGSNLEANRVALLWLLRTEMGLGVNHAKALLDCIVGGKTISLDVATRVRAETLTKRINYLGWNAEMSDPNTPLYPE